MISNQTPYITLCSYNTPSFGWVDFSGYITPKDEFEVTHVASFKELEATSKFGGDSVLPLDPRANEIWTAFFTASGVVFKPRNFKFPGVWEHEAMAMFPYIAVGKVKVLANALRGKWQGGLVPTKFAALSAAQTNALLTELSSVKCVYRASQPELRCTVIANMGTLAVQANGSLPQAMDLWKVKPPVKKKKQLPAPPLLTPKQEMAKAMTALGVAGKDQFGSTTPAVEVEVEVPRQMAQVAPATPTPAPKKGKKAPKTKAEAPTPKPPMKVVKAVDGGNPFQALS